MKKEIALFEGKKIRRIWDETKATGKYYATAVASTEVLFRLIQSIPSPHAEPFKLWLAKVGYERIQEISDPEQALNRSRDYWQKMGRSEKWIQQRMMGQEIRNKLTEENLLSSDMVILKRNNGFCHPLEEGDPVYNHIQISNFSLDSRLRGNDSNKHI